MPADIPLETRIASKGFTPGRRDVAPIVQLLIDTRDESVERTCEDALRRADAARVIADASAAYEAAPQATRHRLVRVVGRVATPERAAGMPLLLRVLSEGAGRARREAIRALGREASDTARKALLALTNLEATHKLDPSEERALAEALGKAGAAEASAFLAASTGDDVHTARVRAKARLVLDRTLARDDDRGIVMDADVDARVRFSCRGGLETMLVRALEDVGISGAKPAGSGFVEAHVRGPLSRVYDVRLWTTFGFTLEEPVHSAHDSTLADRVAAALGTPACAALVARVSHGAPTFRVALASGAKKRALVWEIAERVNNASTLKNDPHQSLFTLHVDDRGANAARAPLVLAPTAAADFRFNYRVADVPAASHPTLAAALVRVAGARENDVVWDPFCGSALELVERARMGGFRAALGTDIDPRALAAAQENIDAAGVTHVTLAERDALEGPPRGLGPVTLIVTNPPLGRRVVREKGLAEMLDEFCVVAANALAPRGRFVWFSPHPERTRAAARRAGLSVHSATMVDMGGFPCELQRFDK